MVGVRRWIYVVAGSAFVGVILLTTYDQLAVEHGDDASYLLGKATPAVVWILTLVTPFALFDFFTWLYRSRSGTSGFWWAMESVLAGFMAGWFTTKRWSLEWLVGDVVVSFDRDEFFEIVVGLWSACLIALVAWTRLRSANAGQHP